MSSLIAPSLNNAPAHWLGATRLLDLDDSKVRIQAMRLTQLAETDAQKAVLVHNFIKQMPFGCVARFDHATAGAVLRSNQGDCHTKGTLFVALLRCAGVPARLRFVTLTGAFLHGIIDVGDNPITHAIGEVFVGGRWVQTDTYVTDTELESEAAVLLRAHGRQVGWGIHIDGWRFWDGLQDAHGQFVPSDAASLPLRDWGVAHDPADFYGNQTHPDLGRSWLTRAKWMVAAGVVNRRTQQLRGND